VKCFVILIGGNMGTVKLNEDGSIEIDPYTEPLRDDAVMMLEGLNELIARFDGLAATASTRAQLNLSDEASAVFWGQHRMWKTAADEVRQLRDRFSAFKLDVSR
jgi:hypothetical protein